MIKATLNYAMITRRGFVRHKSINLINDNTKLKKNRNIKQYEKRNIHMHSYSNMIYILSSQ